ncbi:hypothetical protein LCGC14_2002240 [marine sediment metagenome]|uniref:Uncharacterized protein n=1 Tax=marine sediment metagenome TaxID=412755 RepID=A0A0F9HZY5_9ZZZZ
MLLVVKILTSPFILLVIVFVGVVYTVGIIVGMLLLYPIVATVVAWRDDRFFSPKEFLKEMHSTF